MAEIPEWTAALLKGEFEPMRALVRELAESEPYTDESETLCRFCGGGEDFTSDGPHYHLDTCLWLRARKMAGLT